MSKVVRKNSVEVPKPIDTPLLGFSEDKRSGTYSHGRFTTVNIIEGVEFGEMQLFVDRISKKKRPQDTYESRLVDASPHSRFYCSHMVNVLHRAYPDIFPETIDARSIRFDDGVSIIRSKHVKRHHDAETDISEPYKQNLWGAGFVFDPMEGNIINIMDESKQVRPFFFEIMGVDYPKLVQFVKSIDDGDERKKGMVLERLGKLRNALVNDLIREGLTDQNPSVRRHSSTDLGLMGDHRAFEPLVTALSEDNDYDTRYNCAVSMAIIDPVKATDIFKKIILSEKESLRIYAALRGTEKLNDEQKKEVLSACRERIKTEPTRDIREGIEEKIAVLEKQ